MKILGVVVNNKVLTAGFIGAVCTLIIWGAGLFGKTVDIPPTVQAAILTILMTIGGFSATSNTIGGPPTETPVDSKG